jgi:pimeloyl-ACP methyl ester carboxylesterase
VRSEWNVYFVEKRGVEFGECEPDRGAQDARAEYREHASYEGRFADVCLVLDHLSAQDSGFAHPLVLIGSSEGSDIAIGVAAKHNAPTHIALLPFSAGHGLFDALTGLRAEFERGDITASEFQEQYDWLVDTFGGILSPCGDSTDRYLWGHTYRRWHSHCAGAVLNDLLSVEVPIFLGIPSLDSCIGVDLAVAECVTHGKTNLTYRNYPNYDHGFFEHTDGGAVCRHSEVLAEVLNWVKA